MDTLTIPAGATTAGNINNFKNEAATTVALATEDTMGVIIINKIRATTFFVCTVKGTAGSATAH